MEEVLKLFGELPAMFNGVKIVHIKQTTLSVHSFIRRLSHHSSPHGIDSHSHECTSGLISKAAVTAVTVQLLLNV